MANVGTCNNCASGQHDNHSTEVYCTCECTLMFMQIITDKHGFVAASFAHYKDAKAFWDGMPDAIRARYNLCAEPIDYRYYYLWTWDHLDSRNESKWKVRIMEEVDVNDFLKKFKRDLELEKREDWDDQYFYLGVVHRDGVGYGLRQELGMPTVTTRELSLLCDHHHMDWDFIVWFRNRGVRYATADRVERRQMCKDKRKRKLVKRLRKAYVAGTITERGKKILRNKGWLKPTSLPYIDPSVNK